MKKVVLAILLACFGPSCGGPEPDAADGEAIREYQMKALSGGPINFCNNNAHCDPGETATNCPHDCSPACNNPTCHCNGVCEASETYASCPYDCPAPCTFTHDDMCSTHPYPLRRVCAPEIVAVCATPGLAYCCNTGPWDSACIQFINISAHRNTCGRGSGACHEIHAWGTPFPWNCGSTAGYVCGDTIRDDYCCNVAWDGYCVAEAESEPDYGVDFNANPPRLPCGNSHCDPGETPNNCAYDCAR